MKRLLALTVLGAALATTTLLSSPPALAQSAPAAAAVPRIVMVKIYVTDFARSERFYQQVFGLAAPRTFNDHEHGFSFPDSTGTANPNSPLLVLMLTPTARPNGVYALTVTDIDAVMAATTANGGTVTRPAAPGTGTRIAMITDPDGSVIEVIQPGARP